MPHFYFHLNECGSVTHDHEGTEVADLNTARKVAIVAARAIMCAEITEGEVCFSCHIDITDEAGQRVLRVPFVEAVKIVGVPSRSPR